MQKCCILTFFCLYILIQGCSNDGKSKIFNPNGDSELALLMRNMYDDGMITKQQLLDGKKPEVNVKFHNIHTAKATQPLELDLDTFHDLATAYEGSVQTFLDAEPMDRVATYTNMINACMNCHQQVCPGPTRKIKHLYLTETEASNLK